MRFSRAGLIGFMILASGCHKSPKSRNADPQCPGAAPACATPIPSPGPIPPSTTLNLTPASDEELSSWLQSKGLSPDLAAVKALDTLNLDLRKLTDSDVRYVLSLPQLRKLSVRGNELTRTGIQALVNADRLVELDISCQTIALRQLPSVDKAGSLQSLTAERIGLDWNYLGNLSGLVVDHLNLGNSLASWKYCPINSIQNRIKITRVGADVAFKSLNLDNVDLDDASLAVLEGQQELETLNLANNPRISDKGIESLVQLPALKSLRLDYEIGSWSSEGNVITDAAVETLKKLPNLESLSLRNRLGITKLHLTEKSIALLAQMTKLRSLDISHLNCRDEMRGAVRYFGETHPDVAALGALVHLEELSLSASILTNDKLLDGSFLRNMSKLRKLELSGFEISESTIAGVGSLPELENLNFADNRMDAMDLSPLYRLPKLRHLDLGYSFSLTSKPLVELIGSTKLESLTMAPRTDRLTPAQPIVLESTTLKSVKIYALASDERISTEWLKALAQMPQLERLEFGNYYNRGKFDQEHLNVLQKASSLRELIISGDSVAQDWSILKDSTRLELLQLNGKSESDVWTTLPLFPQLRTLELPNTTAMKAYLERYPKEQFIQVGFDLGGTPADALPNITYIP